MRFVKNERIEPKYFVPEIAQAIGVSEGAVRGFFTNQGQSTKDGLTLDQIVMVLERPRVRGDGIDFNVVSQIRNRLINEKGYSLDLSDETAPEEVQP